MSTKKEGNLLKIKKIIKIRNPVTGTYYKVKIREVNGLKMGTIIGKVK